MGLKIIVPLLENLLINLVRKKKNSTRSEASDHQGIHGKCTASTDSEAGLPLMLRWTLPWLWKSLTSNGCTGLHSTEVKSRLDYTIFLYRTRWWTGRSMWYRASRHSRERRPLPHALYVSGMDLKVLVHDCIFLNCNSQTQFTKWGLLCVSKILLYC